MDVLVYTPYVSVLERSSAILMCDWLESNDGDQELVKTVKSKLSTSVENKSKCVVCGENILLSIVFNFYIGILPL